MTYHQLVERLRTERLTRRLSQEDVAARVGKSRTLIGAWERCCRTADPIDLARWALVLGFLLDLELLPRAEAPGPAAGMAEEGT